ncbi:MULTISPECIES: hypothetical protein [Staphylococcus]|uniref:hypothetical protein n=1 Tax=Staphylococcus TaxID=1279 RepID=UPI00159F5BF0|nr:MULTISPECIES: hypothetical protein [Staphylococcus]MCH4354060.1 hypothetical protein [Staphylococcus haemolyticus]
MSQTDYQIKPDNIKGNSEETRSISKISYEIENADNKSLKKWQRLFDGWFYDYTWK